jgi:C_GCAxxG_C_C family probable redox protein
MFKKLLKGFYPEKKTGSPVSSLDLNKLPGLAAGRAENFFSNHRLSCSEATLLVTNNGLGGGLSIEQVLSLGSGFGGGVGNSGYTCGALSGGVMALGLFLGPGFNGGLGKREFRKLVGNFHDRFQEEFGTVCCRDLIADFRKDRRGQANFCEGLTGRCTGEVVRLILERRPELAASIDLDFLWGRDSKTSVILKKLLPDWLRKTLD